MCKYQYTHLCPHVYISSVFTHIYTLHMRMLNQKNGNYIDTCVCIYTHTHTLVYIYKYIPLNVY